jgi:hypothetical protein
MVSTTGIARACEAAGLEAEAKELFDIAASTETEPP